MEQISTRMIELEGSFNFRDIGGHKTMSGQQVKWGKLFRSGNLSKLTDKDIERVRALGISSILDLRSVEEIALQPNPRIEGIKNLHIQVIPDEELSEEENNNAQAAVHADRNDKYKQLISNGAADQIMIDLYTQMVSFGDAFKRVFQVLLENSDESVLFHCMVGKDRTGILSALILSALGVSEETILEDYSLTNESFDKIKTAFAGNEGRGEMMNINPDSIQALLEARPEYLAAFFAEVDKEFGSVDDYLREAIGLTKEDRESLQRNYLEGGNNLWNQQ